MPPRSDGEAVAAQHGGSQKGAWKVSNAVTEFEMNIFVRVCECFIRARKVFLSKVEEGYMGLFNK